MASTTALFTGLAGLSSNARRLDVIGNNIANVNSVGYKSGRMMFEPLFSQNLGLGTSADVSRGGTNPTQVGLGAGISGIQRNFSNGSISATGVTTDVAIEGNGFFVLNAAGERVYSRAGAFQLDELNRLVNVNGDRVLGFGVDTTFSVVRGELVDMAIPVGVLTVADETRNAILRGNLNASGTIATTGSVHESSAFFLDAALTIPAAAATDLTTTDVYIDDGAGGSFLAIDGGSGTVITVDGVEKAGKDLGSKSFAFSATPVSGTDDNGTTIQDFMDFFNEYLGLDDSTVGGQRLGGGMSYDDATGVMTVTGNEGDDQALTIASANIVATNNGAGINQPLVMTQTGQADGESARTSFVVYDSLGSPITVDLTMVLQATTPAVGTTWTYIAESSDNAALDRVVGLGTLEFDANGALVSSSNSTFSVERDNGAVSPLTVNMDFDSETGAVSALTSTTSTLASTFQDGSPVGTLSSYAIGEDGTISGAFTNGLTRTLGQLAMATFVNPEGLIDTGNNLYRIGPNSGNPLISAAFEFGAGRMIGGALELSNVDLSQEFINLILASTGYSAASRVITTTDELMDQLLVLGR